MFRFTLLLAILAAVSGFSLTAPMRSFGRSLMMQDSGMKTRSQGGTSPGAGMKPMADGTFKMAGEHPKTFLLEHENGAIAVVDTALAGAVSWKNSDGVELLKPEGILNCWPTAGTPMTKHFMPEERAKKVSFDRMIFKIGALEGGAVDSMPGVEYRVDVTMREDSLEYDVILKNADAVDYDGDVGLMINLSDEAKKLGYKVTGTGYTSISDESASAKVNVPVGKFKETSFYLKVAK